MTGRSDEIDAGAANRGQPAQVEPSGAVVGSGAGAGGGGAPEDIDADSTTGSVDDHTPPPAGTPNTGNDASNHGGR